MWAIKDKTGSTAKCTVGAIEYNGTWMGECYVTVTVESPVPIAFAIGDYIEYRGERFEINYDPAEIKSAEKGKKGDAFKYEQVKFNSLADELARCDFLDYVKEDNQLHYTGLPTFSFFASSIQDLADRIQVNLDRLYTGEQRWNVVVQSEYVNKTDVNISVDKQKVWDALEFVTKAFGANFIVRGRTITIGTAGIPTDELFKFGKGKGLATIQRQAESNQQIITRLRVYGSTDNMPTRYYNKLVDNNGDSYIPNNMAVNFLMLPGFPEKTQDPYIDSPNIEALGIREGSVFFDGTDSELEIIKPSIEGMTAEQLKAAGVECSATGALDEVVGAEQATDDGLWEDLESDEDAPTFTIKIKDLGFDINDHLVTETATISMKSGMLGGRDLTIVKCEKNDEGGYTLTCQRVYDDSLRLYFPYKSYNIKAGDKFVLLHIEMPNVYVKAASQRLLEVGKEYLSKVDYSRSSYSPEIDEIFMARQHQQAKASGGTIRSLHDNIKEGDIMLFADEDLLLDNASVVIDNLQIKEGDEKVPTYKVTLRNEKSVGTIQRLQNQIDAIVSGNGGQGLGGYTATQIRQMIFAYGKERFLSKCEPDIAKKVIRFLEGAEFGEYVKGFAGAAIDRHGNGEFEGLESRSYLKVMELIYNRLNALEGNTSFADVGTVEVIESISDTRAILTMRKRWDGDFTAFQYGDIIYGYVNNLTTTGEYYKTWAWISDVNRIDNTITVNYYPGSEVPAQKNFPMTANMIVTRWGNILAANEQTHKTYPAVVAMQNGQYVNTRQSSFFISCEDGNIVQLLGVDRPILQRGNYGTVLGQMPTGMLPKEVENMLNPQQPYLYARGIIVQDLIRVGYEGLKTTSLNYRGVWDSQTAASPTEFYRNIYGTADVVTWNSYLWQCVTTKTTDEPSEVTGSWINISGEREPVNISLWQIIPSSNVVMVKNGNVIPLTLGCYVSKKSTDGDVHFLNNYDLLNAGVRLYYSVDGINFSEYFFGVDEPLELEDGSDTLELEMIEDGGSGNLTIGGSEIHHSQFNDCITFELRDAITNDSITSLIVPVVIDGKDGENGSHVEFRYFKSPIVMVAPFLSAEDKSNRTCGAGWVTGFLSVSSDEALYMSQALIDGNNNLVGTWSDPVRITGERGAVGPIGERGLMAYPAGEYDKYTTYSTSETSTPVVLDSDTNTYYVLKPGAIWNGASAETYDSPHEDYAMSGSDAKWMLMDQFNSIFANIIMSQFAKIGSSVHWGDFMFSQYGTLRQFVTDSNNIQTEVVVNNSNSYGNFDATHYDNSDESKRPENAPFEPNLLINWLTGHLISKSADIWGKLSTGAAGGRRIIIDPESQQISIFNDDDKEAIILEGKEYSDISSMFESASGYVRIKTPTGSFVEHGNSIRPESGSQSVIINDTEQQSGKYIYTGSPAEITIIGDLSCSAQCSVQTEIGADGLTYNATSMLNVSVYTFSDQECLTLVETKRVANCAAYATGKSPKASHQININNAIKVAAGYHIIRIDWTYICSGPGSSASGFFGDTTPMDATFNSNFYISRIFANGFCFGDRSNDYILGYKTPDGMRFTVENGGFGFDFSHNHPKIRPGIGMGWINMPIPLFHGQGQYSSSNTSNPYSWVANTVSCASQTIPTLSQSRKGQVQITFPSEWPILSPANIMVSVVGYGTISGGSNPIKASIASIQNKSITITLSDDDSANDGGFIIDIQLIK